MVHVRLASSKRNAHHLVSPLRPPSSPLTTLTVKTNLTTLITQLTWPPTRPPWLLWPLWSPYHSNSNSNLPNLVGMVRNNNFQNLQHSVWNNNLQDLQKNCLERHLANKMLKQWYAIFKKFRTGTNNCKNVVWKVNLQKKLFGTTIYKINKKMSQDGS